MRRTEIGDSYISEDTGLVGQYLIGDCTAICVSEVAVPRLGLGIVRDEPVKGIRAAEYVVEVGNRFDGLCHSVKGSYFQGGCGSG